MSNPTDESFIPMQRTKEVSPLASWFVRRLFPGSDDLQTIRKRLLIPQWIGSCLLGFCCNSGASSWFVLTTNWCCGSTRKRASSGFTTGASIRSTSLGAVLCNSSKILSSLFKSGSKRLCFLAELSSFLRAKNCQIVTYSTIH